MHYCEVHNLAVQLAALSAKGDRAAEAHALRIWRARRKWGGSPTAENWAAIFEASKKAQDYYQGAIVPTAV